MSPHEYDHCAPVHPGSASVILTDLVEDPHDNGDYRLNISGDNLLDLWRAVEYEVKSNLRLEAEIKRLRAAIESLADEAAQHGEYNPIGDIVRLPLGYQKIIRLAHAALSLPNNKASE